MQMTARSSGVKGSCFFRGVLGGVCCDVSDMFAGRDACQRFKCYIYFLVVTGNVSISSRDFLQGHSVFFVTCSSGNRVYDLEGVTFPSALRSSLPMGQTPYRECQTYTSLITI